MGSQLTRSLGIEVLCVTLLVVSGEARYCVTTYFHGAEDIMDTLENEW